MMPQDPREPLGQGYKLSLTDGDFVMREVIGYGGSCLAYSAKREPTDYERGIGMQPPAAVIKEFYPLELASSITREANGELRATPSATDFWNALKNRFESGAAEQVAFYGNDSNHSLPPARITQANGTAYSVVALTNGQILSDCSETLSVNEKTDVITSLCNAVKNLHDNGKLYLDLKPSNIFLFEKEPNETRRVALFDFDTTVAVGGITNSIIPYSEGWSPREQVNVRRNEISCATDIYTIGAVYYWLLSGKKITDDILDEIARKRFGFLDDIQALAGYRLLKDIIKQTLAATLKRQPKERAQKVEDIPL
jgi:serine/threonine protein kinase